MKIPLRYQMTEDDCGSVSLLNCVAFLFEVEEMPLELIKLISATAIDCYDDLGNLKAGGTTSSMMKFISRWVDLFATKKGIPLKAKYLSGLNVSPYEIAKCIKERGCVYMRTIQSNKEHFVILTAIDDNFVYLFDPTFRLAGSYKGNKNIEFISGHPFTFNRRVKLEQFLDELPKEFALGPVEKREVILFDRDDSIMTHQFG